MDWQYVQHDAMVAMVSNSKRLPGIQDMHVLSQAAVLNLEKHASDEQIESVSGPAVSELCLIGIVGFLIFL